MPLGRYFVFTGAFLLALLFLADWYMPELAVTSARADVDRTIIRLHSSHRWPERIVIDTALPTIVPPPVQIAEPPPATRPSAQSPTQALAMATPIQATAPANAFKPPPKRRTKIVRTGGRLVSYEAIGLRDGSAVW